MLKSNTLRCVLLLVIAFVGCGPKELPFTDHSKDADAFGRSIKILVLSTADELKTSKQPTDALRTIVQSLSELDACPTGEYLPTYKELHKLSSELLAQCEKSKPSDYLAKLSAIAEKAKTLPGVVRVEKESSTD
ncbi:MAG: hypothetical protein ABL921_27195 [Pirellula sp.]